MSVVFKLGSVLSRISPLWIMALSAYSVLCAVLLTSVRETAFVRGSNDFDQVNNAFKLYNTLGVLSKVSPVGVMEGVKRMVAQSRDGVDEGCSAAVDYFLSGVGAGKMWAIQMVDASSKVPEGLLDGDLADLGAYDECVGVAVNDVTAGVTFSGQHCLAVLHLHFSSVPGFAPPDVLAVLGDSLALTFAFCLPSTCSPATLSRSLDSVADEINPYLSPANLTITFSVATTDCHVKQRPPLDTAELVGVIVILCSLVLVAISTAIDLTLVYQNGQRELRGCLRLATAFSLRANGRRLMDTRVADDSLSVLHSLKFLGIAWVTLGHRIRFSVQAPLTNLLRVADYIQDWSSMIVLNATLSVDVFFLISGILNTYVYMNMASRRGKTLLSHINGYVHRYLRLTPAYALMILVTTTWLYRLGDGPLWDRLVGDARSDCTRYWWTGLLYINNYYNPDENCMMQSWYLAADMQLFWLSPLVLYPLYRWPKLGLINLLFLVIISIIIPFLVAYYDKIKTPIPISFDEAKVDREMAELYFPTHTKAVSYLIGILTGYYLHLLRSNKVTLDISRLTNAVLWALAVASLGYGLFGGYYIFQLDSPYDQWQSSLYIGVYRFFWSIGLAWVILACTAGYGGFVNSWLSAPGFAPLGRLTYCIYLTHVAVILYSVGTLRQPQHFTYYEMVVKFLGEFVIATFLAMLLSLTIEAPIMVLEKIFFNSNRRQSRRIHTTTDSSVKLSQA